VSIATAKILVALCVNGEKMACAFHPNKTLLEVLREDLGLTGTKHGCELGHCGACTVLLDGEPVLSCLTLAAECGQRTIETVEGLAKAGTLHPVQRAFVECGAALCGYCTPGFLLGAVYLLQRTWLPGEDEIRAALAGHLCRCTGYTKIIEAVALAAARCAQETSDV